MKTTMWRSFSRQARLSSSVSPAAYQSTTFSPAILCGIFDDPAIVSEMRQACTTIRKAVRSSKALHETIGSDLLSLNQTVRWINTKEEHSSKIISLISDYCLGQRVKRGNFKTESDYLRSLKVHHAVMQAAMKAKQSMDESDCIALEHAVEDFSKMYTK
jgi:hypothetical protein